MSNDQVKNQPNQIGEWIGGILIVMILLIAFRWPSFVQFGIEQDLRSYERQVRKSKLTLEEKQRLLDRIENLENRLKVGDEICTLRWVTTDKSLREMLNDGIQADEGVLIERELKRVEGEFVSPSRQP